jgi:methionine sulfoxide reductase heme-binding subunit
VSGAPPANYVWWLAGRSAGFVAMLLISASVLLGLALAADPWLRAGLSGVTLPFALSYRPLWTGLGIIGGYLAAVLGLSFYLRRRIGGRTWRRMHRLTVVAYVLCLAHALGSGTDAAIPAVRAALLASALPVVLLFGLRTLRAGRPARAASAPAAACRSAQRKECLAPGRVA